MAPWPKIAAAVAAGATAVAAAAAAVGARAWSRATAGALGRLHARGGALRGEVGARGRGAVAGADRYDPAQLAGLPAPVVRYFAFALTPGHPLVRRARLAQEGTFATARDRWVPFTATEDFTVLPPGFLWDARIRMAPFVVARVRDSYIAGEGTMHAAIAGLITIVDQRGTPEMAAGSLLRYLAEAVWLPTALLPACGVRWDPIDETSARATITDAGTTVSMDVRFGSRGQIESVSALRHRDVKGTPVLTPWRGRFEEYARVAGMMVPARGEVGWELPDGWFPYWRGLVVSSELDLASPRD